MTMTPMKCCLPSDAFRNRRTKKHDFAPTCPRLRSIAEARVLDRIAYYESVGARGRMDQWRHAPRTP